MENELLNITTLLNGYGTSRFQVLYAQKTDNGYWNLTIRNLLTPEVPAEAPKESEPQEAGDDNN